MANEGLHSVLTLSLTIGSPYANLLVIFNAPPEQDDTKSPRLSRCLSVHSLPVLGPAVRTLPPSFATPYANWVNQLLFAANMSSVNFHISSREQTAAVSGSRAIAW